MTAIKNILSGVVSSVLSNVVQLVGRMHIRTDYKDEGLSSDKIDAILSKIADSGVTGRIVDIRGNDPRTSDTDYDTIIANGNQVWEDVVANQPEVDTYIDGLTTPLSSGQIALLNTLVVDLKDGLSITNLSDAFDVICILAGETEESSLKNLVKDSHHASTVNSPTFTALEGFTGNGTNNYINHNYNASTQGVNCALNSTSLGIYSRTESNPSATQVFAGARDSSAILMQTSSTGGVFYYANDSTDSAYQFTALQSGLFAANRVLSTEKSLYKNGASAGSHSVSSNALPNLNVYSLARNNSGVAGRFRACQLSLLFLGKGFTTAEMVVITNAFEDYMDANGKGVIS